MNKIFVVGFIFFEKWVGRLYLGVWECKNLFKDYMILNVIVIVRE